MNVIDSTIYDKQGTYTELEKYSRQSIYNDGVFLYLPHHYNENEWQDVFTISTLEYYCTQNIDVMSENEGGEYFDGKYYILTSIDKSGFVYEANVKKGQHFNYSYSRLTNTGRMNETFSSGTRIYGNALNTTLFADGKSNSHGINRISAVFKEIQKHRSAGCYISLNGDFTTRFDGTLTLYDFTSRLVLNGGDNDITFIPRLQLDNINAVELNDITIKSSLNNIIYVHDVTRCKFTNIKLTSSVSVQRGIRLYNSFAEFNNVGFTNITPSIYISYESNSTAKGRIKPDYDASAYIQCGVFKFDDVDSTITGNGIFGYVSPNGMIVNGSVNLLSNSIAANTAICQLPTTNKQFFETNIHRIARTMIKIAEDIYYDLTDNKIYTLTANLPTGYYHVNGFIPNNEIST